eukprot:5318317-Amphidinium_carterae.1
MHQPSLGRFLGPCGSASARREREVEERLGLPCPEKGRKVVAPSRRGTSCAHRSRLVEVGHGHFQ